jgi:hypothetical protein
MRGLRLAYRDGADRPSINADFWRQQRALNGPAPISSRWSRTFPHGMGGYHQTGLPQEVGKGDAD